MAAATAYRQANPFTPMFGRVPAYMAGREQIIDDMVLAFESADSDPNLCSIFYGARGTGKTALLAYLSYRAQQEGWITANVTASDGMLEDILQRLNESAAHLIEKPASRRVNSVGIASIGSMSWENVDIEYEGANWRTKMNALFAQLEATGTGVLIAVDEVDASFAQMTELVTTYQHFVSENKKVALLMAGLPFRVLALLTGKSTSFLRRAAQHSLGSISPTEVKEAFRLTIEDGGKSISDEAVDRAAEAIDGFPFMFQLVGYRAWNASRQAAEVSLEDVERGAKLAQEELESRVLPRLQRTFTGDLDFLRAMNPEGTTTRQELAARLKKSSGSISTYKKRLIEAGVIEEPLQGRFEFALPGFGRYVASLC
ncbi:MAG: AAA family ATPase [Collinsella aerofaciens]